jgi:hypothetical protein
MSHWVAGAGWRRSGLEELVRQVRRRRKVGADRRGQAVQGPSHRATALRREHESTPQHPPVSNTAPAAAHSQER